MLARQSRGGTGHKESRRPEPPTWAKTGCRHCLRPKGGRHQAHNHVSHSVNLFKETTMRLCSKMLLIAPIITTVFAFAAGSVSANRGLDVEQRDISDFQRTYV